MPEKASLETVDIATWLAEAHKRDPEMAADIEKATPMVPESGLMEELAGAPAGFAAIELETIVLRTGRPVLPIRSDAISTEGAFIESDSLAVVQRLKECAPNFARYIPSVGRIDVANSMFGLDWIGTAWLVDRDVAVTNRHVAELVAAENGGRFVFRPGREGAPIRVSIDFVREIDAVGGAVFEVDHVIWIERDPNKPDIALLKLKESPAERYRIELATDSSRTTDVAVIGYPARAPQRVIPEQDLMERIFAGRYDIKRIAPGLWGSRSPDGWETHDCTTLGGNSGSVVMDIRTGKAVGLHFAGAFLLRNYAVSAATVQRYLDDKPWHPTAARRPAPLERRPAQATGREAAAGREQSAPTAGSAPGVVQVTVPLHITISLGSPEVQPALASVQPSRSRPGIGEAVARAQAELGRSPGIVFVRPGYLFDESGAVTDEQCIVVVTDAAVPELSARLGDSYADWPLEVRPADAEDLAEAALAEFPAGLESVAQTIAYDDDARTAAVFALEPVEVEATMICHVGPERSWAELKPFLASARSSLLTAMYEFNAAHIADAIEDRLGEGVAVRTVLDGLLAAREAEDDRTFSQREKFRQWSDRFGDGFGWTYVPEGRRGLIWNAYHIKVAVKDDVSGFWLSSGNWKPSSQPRLEPAEIAGASAALPGNREWHVVVQEHGPEAAAAPLTRCFAEHILADERFSSRPSEEAVAAPTMVDIPVETEVIEEAPTARPLLPSVTVSGRIRIQPLLTPDRGGEAFCRPVLDLIRNARRSLLFQIPYITPHPVHAPQLLIDLVEELAEATRRLRDCRIILRSDTAESMRKSIEALKARDVDVERIVRVRPSTHTKGMIVDGRHCLIGSHNWSGSGVTVNRDASLIVYDNREVAGYFGRAFEVDWQTSGAPRARGPRPQGARLAEGSSPPPGFRRVPLAAALEG